MTAATHPVFCPPDNPNTVIRRYLDLAKFLSMLENGGLYFSRADHLGDDYEGWYTDPDLKQIAKRKHENPRDEEEEKRIHFLRKWTVVSCWHMNEYESDAMWTRYARDAEGIAI